MRPRPLEIEVRPPCPYRLSRRGGRDGVMRSRGGVLTRVLHVEGWPVVVRAWQRRDGVVVIRGEGVAMGAGREASPARGAAASMPPLPNGRPCAAEPPGRGTPPTPRQVVEIAVCRMRFAFGVDDDLRPFYGEFKRDRFLGPAIRRAPWLRPRRRPVAWEALAWAVTEQLIESSRAAAIQRRMVRRWGTAVDSDGGEEAFRGTPTRGRPAPLRDVPSPEAVARLAPAELAACDLAPARAVALVKCAREVVRERVDPADAVGDARLLRIPEIGPWTLQCLGLHGRGEEDTLPAGDLAYVKLVGVARRLGRRATVEEVEDFFARFEPYRGLAGTFALRHPGFTRAMARGLGPAPDRYAEAA